MIFKTSDSIMVNSSIEKVSTIIKNISNWPEIFPPCKKIEILQQNDKYTKFYLTAVSRGITNRWLSEQVILEHDKLIKFRQIESSWPLSFMQGEWELQKFKDQTLITMNHRFGIKGTILFQYVIGIIIKKFFVDKNTRLELQAIANFFQ